MTQVPYGKVITAGDVLAGARAVLVEYLPGVLASVCEQHGWPVDDVPPPRGYGAEAPQDDVAQAPVAVLVAPVLAGRPEAAGNGLHRVRWQLGAGVVNADKTADLAQAKSHLYVAAVRATLLQHKSLDGVAEGLSWTDETSDPVAYNNRIAAWGGGVVVEVTVLAAFDGYATAGPNPFVETHRIEILRSA